MLDLLFDCLGGCVCVKEFVDKIFRVIIFIRENNCVCDLCSPSRHLTLERNPSDFTKVPGDYKHLPAPRLGTTSFT